MTHLAVSGHELHADQVVTGETKPPRQPTKPTPKCQARHTGIGDLSKRGRQGLLLSGRVDVRPPSATAHAGGSIIGTHHYRAHGRQIDDETPVARRVPREAVPAAADSKQQFTLARKGHGAHDVCSIGTAGDQCRVLVDHSVPDPARRLIPLIPWDQQRAAQARTKVSNRGALYGCFSARELYGTQTCRSRL